MRVTSRTASSPQRRAARADAQKRVSIFNEFHRFKQEIELFFGG
jgi:hypothetical protein